MESTNNMATIRKTASAKLPTRYGVFHMEVFKDESSAEHVALIKGEIQDRMLVRLHSSCVTGDIFASLKCDCGEQLEKSMKKIQENKSGIILYLNQEGRGIGLTNKIKAYALQEKGYDTVEANQILGLPVDARDYTLAGKILEFMGVSEIDLLTNNPDKTRQLRKSGLKINKRIPLEVTPNSVNRDYLRTKKMKMSHLLSFV